MNDLCAQWYYVSCKKPHFFGYLVSKRGNGDSPSIPLAFDFDDAKKVSAFYEKRGYKCNLINAEASDDAEGLEALAVKPYKFRTRISFSLQKKISLKRSSLLG